MCLRRTHKRNFRLRSDEVNYFRLAWGLITREFSVRNSDDRTPLTNPLADVQVIDKNSQFPFQTILY
jgi:hypothetical protein